MEAFSQMQRPLKVPQAVPSLEPRDDIRPTETAPVLRRVTGGIELARSCGGFAPDRLRAGPVINVRSEGHHRPARMVPLHRAVAAGGERGAGGFTLLTATPGSDAGPIHGRQMMVLERSDWLAWLDPSRLEAELLRPLPAGGLPIEQVRSAGRIACPPAPLDAPTRAS